ncbi:GPO family capsid scaffolding protein [Brevundimonas diminuta]|uniref:GPO family capsid scaffolding protein n=1 Tax=Brevundimonas diminuta TaxID=293 RepID=UPI001908699E|nr:GPO family capsid scaffolding protein [Brevundimonas diminuta]MBK1970808.1 GPO family capsid scaffolding protein [Brevundimonas diminuta]
MSKKRTTKFTRVAVAGLTASDGRTIEPQWLRDMAATYDYATYPARLNVEHYRNASATGPFPALGDVIALKVQEDDINIAGKTEKRVALYAQIEGNETLQGYVAADQKKFTSIEVEPNFAGSGKAYLMGLAATDSPASLGTEALQFSARTDDAYAKQLKADLDARKQHNTCLFSAALETRIEFADQENPTADAETLIDRIVARFTKALPGSEPTPPAASQPPAGQPDVTGLMTAFTDGLRELGQSFSQALAQASQDTNARFAKLESEHAALKSDIEGTPERSYSARPTHAGGDGAQLTDC